MSKRNVVWRWLLGILSVVSLVCIFMFQHINVAAYLGIDPGIKQFIVNRSIRFILNDLLTILLIYSLFKERKYVIFSIWVQIAGLFFLLLPYFLIKLEFPKYNGPMINFLHRLILNPTLLLLLIPAFYFQRVRSQHNPK